MTSKYFLPVKSGPLSELRRALVDWKLNRNSRMVRADNRHGRDAGRVVQISFDKDVEAEFLRLMGKANIRQLEHETDPRALLPDNRDTGGDQDKLTTAHLEMKTAQWMHCADAAKFEPTRLHFTCLIPRMTQRLREQLKEIEARGERES